MALGSAARSYPSTKQAPEAKTGGKGIRTPGLLIANETLYQLSYTPILSMKIDQKESTENLRCPRILQQCAIGCVELTVLSVKANAPFFFSQIFSVEFSTQMSRTSGLFW